MGKIFGLGYHKTGSTTLETALITLGYDCKGKHDHLFEAISNDNWAVVDEAISKHDAFRDMPWPLFYQELDQRYPGSKFILTVRDSEKWIASCGNHYKNIGDPLFARIYGDGFHFPVGNEKRWIHTYEAHNEEVRSNFKKRPEDFLEVNWEAGDGWNKLCQFLDKPVPGRPFPHANKGEYSFVGKVVRKLWWLVDRQGFKKRNRDL